MAIKILGGDFRGFPLNTPKADTTRPTSVVVRRKLFDWRQNLEGYQFIDLCSGSGAVGFEALSRHADKVWLNDMVKGSFLTIKDNRDRIVKSFNVDADKIKVTQLDSRKWLEKELPYEFTDTENAIVYLDPPYEDHALYVDLLALLKKQNYKGEVWVESDLKKGPTQEKITGAFRSVIKVFSQGDHFVVVGFLI